jgi:hypothetical protein
MEGQSNDTGQYDLDSPGSFPGFGSGMMVELFQMDGILH